MKKLVVAALALLGMTLSVQAATVTANTNALALNNAVAPLPNSSAIFSNDVIGNDLDDGGGPNTAPYSRSPWDVNGSCVGICTVSHYSSVGGGGFARYDFGQAMGELSLIWGSPDNYNVLEFLNQAGTVIDTVVGNNASITTALANAGFAAGQRFVNATITGVVFYSVVFRSINSDAFEYVFNARNNVVPTPIPAGILLLLTGLLGLGGLGRLARRSA